MTETNPPSRRWSRYWKKGLSWIVLLGFIGFIQYWLGWGSLLRPWLALDSLQIALALTFMLLSYALRTWRLYDYFPQALHGHWQAVFRLSLLHNLMNNLLPARAGEVSFPILMKRYFGVSYTQALAALLWFRFLDLHTIMCVAAYPLLGFTPLKQWAVPLILLWLCLPIGIYLLRQRLRHALLKREDQVSQHLNTLLTGLPSTTTCFWRSWALTWLNWVCKLATLAWLLAQFIHLPTWQVYLTAVIGGELTSILPLHAPAGIGTYEAGIVAALTPFASLESATRAAINVHIFVLGSAILSGIVAALLLKRPQVATQMSV